MKRHKHLPRVDSFLSVLSVRTTPIIIQFHCLRHLTVLKGNIDNFSWPSDTQCDQILKIRAKSVNILNWGPFSKIRRHYTILIQFSWTNCIHRVAKVEPHLHTPPVRISCRVLYWDISQSKSFQITSAPLRFSPKPSNPNPFLQILQFHRHRIKFNHGTSFEICSINDQRRAILFPDSRAMQRQFRLRSCLKTLVQRKQVSVRITQNPIPLIIVVPEGERVNQFQLRLVHSVNDEPPGHLQTGVRRQPEVAHHVENRHAVPGVRLHATATLAPASSSRHHPHPPPPSRRMRPMPEQPRPDSSPTRVRQSEQPTPPRPPRPPRPNDPIPPDREPEIS